MKIGAEAVRAAAEVLRRYRAGKQNLDRRIIDNEQFWKLRHWEQMEKAGEGGNPEDVRPASGWLVNCILSKHADAMDCYPEPTVLPREPGRPAGGRDAEPYPAGAAEKRPVQADVFQGVVGQAEVRVRRVRPCSGTTKSCTGWAT